MDSPDHLRLGFLISAFAGSLPAKYIHSNLRGVYSVYQISANAYFTIFVITQVIQLYYIPLDNYQEFLDNAGVSLLYIIGIIKLYSCKGDKAVRLIERIQETEVNIKNENQSYTAMLYNKHIQHNKKISLFFIGVTSVTISAFWIYPGLYEYMKHTENTGVNGTTEYIVRALPFSSWFPFNKYKHYYLSYALQVIAGFYGASYVMCADLFFFGLMVFCLGQVRTVKSSFRRFKYVSTSTTKAKYLDEDAVLQNLRKCIIQHQNLIQ